MNDVADFDAAERAIHQRTALSFTAARAAGLAGRFETREVAGLLLAVTTSPALGFLNSVAGVTASSVRALPEALDAFAAVGAPNPSIVTAPSSPPIVREDLQNMGFHSAGKRPLAYVHLSSASAAPAGSADDWSVREVDDADGRARFLEVLLGGYGLAEPVHALIGAEHSAPEIRCFLAWRGDQAQAAAALSQHGRMAVLGGAATLSSARGAGGQGVLLAHRLRAALTEGLTMAVATAAPQSGSVRNLRRAGFRIIERCSWRLP